jgi:hypothetical protein
LLVFDDVIHQRLGERRLVELVVAHLTVADKVDEDVSVEFLAILSSDFEHTCYVLQRISIDVENWRLNRLGKIRAVIARTTLVW